MAIVPFKYYLHDGYNSAEFQEVVGEQIGIEISDELMEKIGRLFYEVELSCTLDTETGEVKILSVS